MPPTESGWLGPGALRQTGYSLRQTVWWKGVNIQIVENDRLAGPHSRRRGWDG